ncbi:TPA: DUF1627 domain-containing protein [Escherichia coli]|nr:DUF1627 domain-containing protein [Escherichia coli]
METVFDALKAMGKATSIELAARLDISREEVLSELWELKKAGFVDKTAYTWRVAENNVQQEQSAQAELPEETTTATVAKISECDLTATIEQRGPQTADELTTLFDTTSRKVASTLAMAISKGRLIRVNQGGKFRYCIPGDNLPAEPKAASVAETDGKAFPQPACVALPVQEAATQEDIKTETMADIVQSLPSLEAEPVTWRYRYVRKGVTNFQEKPWVGDWKYVPTKEDCNDRPNYEIQALFTAQPVPLTPEGLIKAVRFYEQVKSENPPVETGAWKDAVDWVLKEACQAVNIGIKGE